MHIYDYFNKSIFQIHEGTFAEAIWFPLGLRIGKTSPFVTQVSSSYVFSSFGSCVSQTCGLGTHSAILFPSSRLGGCELAVKTTRPPLVWFMSLDFRPLLSSHSGSGSLGTHAALTPSCSGEGGGAHITSFEIQN